MKKYVDCLVVLEALDVQQKVRDEDDVLLSECDAQLRQSRENNCDDDVHSAHGTFLHDKDGSHGSRDDDKGHSGYTCELGT